jgi:hypothetical protein
MTPPARPGAAPTPGQGPNKGGVAPGNATQSTGPVVCDLLAVALPVPRPSQQRASASALVHMQIKAAIADRLESFGQVSKPA